MGCSEVVRAHIKLAKCSSKVDKSSKADNQRIASNTTIYKNNRGYPSGSLYRYAHMWAVVLVLKLRSQELAVKASDVCDRD